MNLLTLIEDLEQTIKHQPGRHDQQRHAGGRGGGAAGGDASADQHFLDATVKAALSGTEHKDKTDFVNSVADWPDDADQTRPRKAYSVVTSDLGKVRSGLKKSGFDKIGRTQNSWANTSVGMSVDIAGQDVKLYYHK